MSFFLRRLRFLFTLYLSPLAYWLLWYALTVPISQKRYALGSDEPNGIRCSGIGRRKRPYGTQLSLLPEIRNGCERYQAYNGQDVDQDLEGDEERGGFFLRVDFLGGYQTCGGVGVVFSDVMWRGVGR